MTAAIGSTPGGIVCSGAPDSASSTTSASLAGNGTTANRLPIGPARAAIAGAPIMWSPVAPELPAGTMESPMASS
jgi:hypothetical protein